VTLVDSNVILDIVSADDEWMDWSTAALARQADAGPLAVNPSIYAEAAGRFARIEDLEAALPSDNFQRLPLPWEAAFLSIRSFVAYRRRGAHRRPPLPDFYIGAHALVGGMTLLMRDPARYCTCFPRLRLVAP
jgi:hypothetical protein